VKHHLHLLLAAASSLAFASAARAQDVAAAPADEAVEVTEENPDAAAEIEFLKAQVEALQARVEQLAARTAKAEPTWKGAPQWAGDGFTWKVRGRLMYDSAFINSPFATKPNKNLGFNSRIRRLRLGVEG
jgi:phosphate-selective porin OprO/OprP